MISSTVEGVLGRLLFFSIPLIVVLDPTMSASAVALQQCETGSSPVVDKQLEAAQREQERLQEKYYTARGQGGPKQIYGDPPPVRVQMLETKQLLFKLWLDIKFVACGSWCTEWETYTYLHRIR